MLRLYFIVFLSAICLPAFGQGALETKTAVILSRVACCRDTAWQEAEFALADELRLLNIPVTTVDAPLDMSADLPGALMTEARDRNAGAVISVLRKTGPVPRVEVWIYDRVTDKTLVKSWTLENPNDPDAAMVAGIRGVEALRASLLEIENRAAAAPPPPRDAKPSPPFSTAEKKVDVKDAMADASQHRTLVSEEIKQVGVGAGPSLLASFQGAGVRGGFDVAFYWQPLRFFALHFDTAYWPLGGDIEKNGAVTALKPLLVRGGLTFVISDKRIVRPSVSILGGGFMAFAEGRRAGEDQTPVSDITKVGYVGGLVDTAFRISRRFFLRLNVGVGVTLPEVVLHHGDVEAASLGRPLLDASLRAEFRLP